MAQASVFPSAPSRAIEPGEPLEVTRITIAASMRSVLALAEKPGPLTLDDLHVMKAHLQSCQRKLFVQGVRLHQAQLRREVRA